MADTAGAECVDTLPVIETTTVQKTINEDTGTKMINYFEVIRSLGKGAFGKVKLCRDTRLEENNLFALKIMDKTVLKKKRQGMSNMLQSVQKEIAIMKKLNHVNCVRMFEVIDDPTSHKLYLRLEFVSGGQCMPSANHTTPLPLDTAQGYFADLILGLEYLHHNHVLHRDIKPENLLVCKETGRLKLADFGVSQFVNAESEGDLISKSAGTPAFMAPESCVPGAFHGKLADIWAAGVSLYFLVHGKCPFICANVLQLYDMIREQEITYDAGLPVPLLDLLQKMLEKDPAQRMRIEQIKQHPWFRHPQDEVAPSTVVITQKDISEAFTTFKKVLLLMRMRRVLKQRLTRARESLAVRRSQSPERLSMPRAPEIQATSQAHAAAAAPPGPATGMQMEIPASPAAPMGKPEGLTEYISDDEIEGDADLINELCDAVEQADTQLQQLHLQRTAPTPTDAQGAEDHGTTCTQS